MITENSSNYMYNNRNNNVCTHVKLRVFTHVDAYINEILYQH
jgi:hypothetical protein